MIEVCGYTPVALGCAQRQLVRLQAAMQTVVPNAARPQHKSDESLSPGVKW